MVTNGRPLWRTVMTVGAALVLAVTTSPSPGRAAGPDLDPIPIVWPDCFGRQYLPPVYLDGQLVRPGSPGVISRCRGSTRHSARPATI
jgi:hypothetical protein